MVVYLAQKDIYGFFSLDTEHLEASGFQPHMQALFSFFGKAIRRRNMLRRINHLDSLGEADVFQTRVGGGLCMMVRYIQAASSLTGTHS